MNARSALRTGLMTGLLRLGARLTPPTHYKLQVAVDQLDLGRWLAMRELRPAVYQSRFEVFQHVGQLVANSRVLYLEFGVARGSSMRYWSDLLRHSESQLHGFDSFEGLPVDWKLSYGAGLFDLAGTPPEIDDTRVQFHVGWFDETLPKFVWPSDWDVLVVNIDCDLYSSTQTVLSYLEPHLHDGSFIYFDEIRDRADERRALDELLAQQAMTLNAVAATRDCLSMAFRVTRDRSHPRRV